MARDRRREDGAAADLVMVTGVSATGYAWDGATPSVSVSIQ